MIVHLKNGPTKNTEITKAKKGHWKSRYGSLPIIGNRSRETDLEMLRTYERTANLLIGAIH